MLTWNGAPLRRPLSEQLTRTLNNLDVIADLAVLPPRWGWEWIDWVGAWGTTTNCCPLEWVEDPTDG